MNGTAGGAVSWISLFKDSIAGLRDGLFLVLLLLLLLSPETVKNHLVAAGFTKGNIGGLEWEGQIRQSAEQTKAVGEVVSKADQNYQSLVDHLNELQASAQDPAVRASLADLSKNAVTSQSELSDADRAVKRSLATQQSIVEAIAPASVANGGWLYLGKVVEAKDQWADGSPVTIAPAAASALARDARLTIRDDTYWRGDSAAGQHAGAAIVAVAKAGAVVRVDDVDYSHARGGGWFVWVRAHREGAAAAG